jgi:hypothetical protein
MKNKYLIYFNKDIVEINNSIRTRFTNLQTLKCPALSGPGICVMKNYYQTVIPLPLFSNNGTL